VVLAGSVGLALLVLLLSSAILPPWPVLTALILVLAGAAAFAWRPVARLYERASLVFESSTGPAIVPHGDLPPPLHDLQGEMDLEKVAIGAGAPSVDASASSRSAAAPERVSSPSSAAGSAS